MEPREMDSPPFDANAYWESGRCPWTFFAFPRTLADADGLPTDAEASRLLAVLKQCGLPAATWPDPFSPDTIYFACPYEVRESLNALLELLQEHCGFEQDFLATRSNRLFSLVDSA